MWYIFDNSARSLPLQKEITDQTFSRNMQESRSLKNPGTAFKFSPELIAEYSSAIHSFSDTVVFIDFSLDSLLGVIDACAGSFFIWDEYSKDLVLKTARGQGQQRLQGTRIKLREGICGLIAEKGFPVLVDDIRTDERFSNLKNNFQYQTYSFLSVPLIFDNKLIGLVNITEKENKQSFTEEDLILATAYARHIAIAYENIKTKSRLRQDNEELNQKIFELNSTLKDQERLVSLGKLSSHLAHELANPLDAIRRFVNLALDQMPEDGPARDFLIKAKQGIRRSIQVIRGLLELSGMGSRNRVRQSEIHSIIDEAIAGLIHDSSYEHVIISRQFCGLPFFVEDCGLQTVFQNLIQNAHHAMNGAGMISIQTEQQNGRVIVRVRDTGTGISEEIQKRIFEPFFTTKDAGKGTGIGLTICREILQRSGGEIAFTEKAKSGAEFIISLPYRNKS